MTPMRMTFLVNVKPDTDPDADSNTLNLLGASTKPEADLYAEGDGQNIHQASQEACGNDPGHGPASNRIRRLGFLNEMSD